MKYTLIVAMDKNGGIGVRGGIPWKIQQDVDMFKFKTANAIVVMGRKTWESIPKRFRPLRDRTNVVITTRTDYHAVGAVVKNSFEECNTWLQQQSRKVFIIGGKDVYEWFLKNNLIDHVCVTHIDNDYGCDTTLTRNVNYYRHSSQWRELEFGEMDFITVELKSLIDLLFGISYHEFRLQP